MLRHGAGDNGALRHVRFSLRLASNLYAVVSVWRIGSLKSVELSMSKINWRPLAQGVIPAKHTASVERENFHATKGWAGAEVARLRAAR